MISLPSELTIPVVEAAQRLEASLQTLSAAVLQDGGPAWVPLEVASPYDRKTAAAAYTRIFYTGHGDGRESWVQPGVVCVSSATVQHVEPVNDAKRAFRQARKALFDALPKPRRSVRRRDEVLNHVLRRAFRHRLHLLACDRHITSLPGSTRRIALTWNVGRVIERTNREEVLALLEKSPPMPDVLEDMSRVAALPAATPLARVRQQAPSIRANVVAPGEARERFQVQAPLPLLLPADKLPLHHMPHLEPPAQRRPPRLDKRIDDLPFLRTLPIHTYGKSALS